VEFAKSSVDAPLGGGQGDPQDPRDLRHAQIGSEAEGESFSLVIAEDRQGVLELVAPFDRLERVTGLVRPGTRLGRDALERPLLDSSPAGAVAQAVEGDGVEPRLLGRPTRPESGSGAQDLLEGVGQEILAQLRVAGTVREEPEQRLGVLLVEPLESRRSFVLRA